MDEIEQKQKDIQNLMRQGKFSDALQGSEAVLSEKPKHLEFLYIKAVCQRYLKDFDGAQSTLDVLIDVQPEFGRAFQEEGHLARDQGLYDAALSAYKKATRYNPGLVASWKAQSDIMARKGMMREAGLAQSQLKRLQQLSPELMAVTNMIHENKILKAEKLCRAVLRKQPKNTEAMRLLAEIGARFGAQKEADFLLESAIEFEPENIQLRLDHIKILRKRQKFVAALEQAESLYNRDPNNPVFQSHLAIESMQTGDHERALTLFDKLLAKNPKEPSTLTSKAHALKTYGSHDEAVACYQAAYKAVPSHGDAYFGLANLKTYRFTDEELELMKSQIGRRDLALMDRVHMYFSLGKAFEDNEKFKESFQHYQIGNDLKHVQSGYDADDTEEELKAQAAICTADLFEKNKGNGHQAPDPIFIVGLPRAGSTLLEQIVASHSQVDGTLELPNILAMAYRLRKREKISIDGVYPKVLHDLPAETLKELGQQFIEETRIHRQDAPFFIDKMPNNFRHIGLISLILPNAKIIDARRHPMACCFSGFKQLFAEGQDFTYSLESVGRYYRDYVNLMDHWDKVLPGKILRVQYEDVVADTEAQVHRILDYLGLPFEEDCLEFHKTKRSVRTASSEQVRQPIYKSGLEQWRNFEPWLDPLKEALGPEILKRYPID